MKGAAVIDYGAGNLRSVSNALERQGEDFNVVSTPGALHGASRIILPGVGSFASGMAALEASGLAGAIRGMAECGVPLLGICLGMQMLMDEGSEGGGRKGLGLLRGSVVPMERGQGLAVPHTGWNSIEVTRQIHLLDGIASGSCFYFVHSYAVAPEDSGIVSAVTVHGCTFPSVISSGCVQGVQFHPEKSQGAGARVLRNFLGGRT